MKVIPIYTADIKHSKSSEIYLNWEIVEKRQCIYNLYDGSEAIYQVRSKSTDALNLDVYENGVLKKRIEISKDKFKEKYHWYFLNSSEFEFLKDKQR